MTTRNTRRPRVERAGDNTGYLPGWFAMPISRHVHYPEEGQMFDTWDEAMEHATGGPLVSEATA